MKEQCPSCGRPMVSGTCPNCAESAVFKILRRDVLLLTLLASLAVLMFVGTRKVAAFNRAENLDMAARQYEIGRSELRAGRVSDAVISFRRAIARDNQNQIFVLALANALVLASKYDEARQVLLNLREVTPQDPQISVQLARVAAKAGSIPEASRYYQNVLYGTETAKQTDEQRNQVRLEFVHYLIGQNQYSLALSELLVFASNLSRHDSTHLQAGQLFLDLGEPQRAVGQFREIRASDPGFAEALAGIGQAELRLGEYEAARRYADAASRADPPPASAMSTLVVANLVLLNDPLAPDLTAKARVRRLANGLNTANQDLTTCLDKMPPSEADNPDALDELRKQAKELRATITARNARPDIDVLRNGINIVYHMETTVEGRCGGTPLTQALLLIGRRRAVTAQ